MLPTQGSKAVFISPPTHHKKVTELVKCNYGFYDMVSFFKCFCLLVVNLELTDNNKVFDIQSHCDTIYNN